MLEFQPINILSQSVYEHYYRQCQEKASNYSFINITAWNDKYHFEWAEADELIWLRYTSDGVLVFAPPVGNWNRQNWEELITKNLDRNLTMPRVPEILALILKEQLPDIQIEPQREHWEYIYKISDLKELSGSAYSTKRKLANTFIRTHPYEFRALREDDAPIVKTFMALWLEQQKQRDNINMDDLYLENKAIEYVLNNWSRLDNLIGNGIWINHKLEAFTIGEALDETTVSIHFEKASLDFVGIYQAVNRLNLEALPQNFIYVNREQDLGLPGLRKAKTDYHPLTFVHKYKLMF